MSDTKLRVSMGGMDALVRLRHELHAHPELAHDEHTTADRIVDFLRPLGPDDVVTGVGGTGIVATFSGAEPGPSLLIRSELDALPIRELVDHPAAAAYASTVDGVSHKCGHDGHMAIVAGVAMRLGERRPDRGAVHLLFQPAEETGTGAAAMLSDPLFDRFRPDAGVALHNMPGHPRHAIVVKPGSMTAAVRSIVIRFVGRAAHASEPEHGFNPSLAVADLVRSCAALEVLDPASDDFRTVTPVHVRVGAVAYGVAPGDGEVHLTMRTWRNDDLERLHRSIEESARELGARDGLVVEVDVVEEFFANENDPELTAIVRQAAITAGLDVIDADIGMRAGEDFGLFGRRFPCCMVLLGSGEDHPPIHDPAYDFPDELIPTGVTLLDGVVREICR